MNEVESPADGRSGEPSSGERRPPQLLILVGLLFLEALVVAAGALYLLVELLVDIPQSYPAALAILALTVLAAVWVGMIAVHTLTGHSWTRAATVVWQVLQASVGLGSLQGLFARPDVGWPLIILAVVVLVLLFTKPVLSATDRGDE